MPKRKRSSWGCVQRVSTGVWRIRWWEDTADGRVRRSETFRGTRRQADDRLAQLRASQGGRYGGSPTLRAAYAAWWLPDAEGRVERGEYRERSLRQAKSIWGVHIEPRWGRVPVDKIKPLDVQEWLSTLTEQTAQKCKSLMRQVLDMCVMYEAVESNPMDKRYRLPATKAPRDTAVYGLDGLRGVWEAVKGSPIEGAVILLAFGGCRVGEALGVMAGEVGLVDAGGVPVATAPIRRQVLNGTGEVSDSLKTDWSYRTAVVPGPLGARLKAVADAASGAGDRWLCDDGMGGPTSQRALNTMWDAALRAAGVERHPVKNLRNSWQTYMHWVMGVDGAMIEKMMGHKGKGITAEHYDRPSAGEFARVAAEAYSRVPFADSWGVE